VRPGDELPPLAALRRVEIDADVVAGPRVQDRQPLADEPFLLDGTLRGGPLVVVAVAPQVELFVSRRKHPLESHELALVVQP
jgi:hypothetical protein